MTDVKPYTYGGVFSPIPHFFRFLFRVFGPFSPSPPSHSTLFFTQRARLAPCELTHVRAPPGDCRVRRAGRKRGARFESTEALAEQPAPRQWHAVPWSCIDAAIVPELAARRAGVPVRACCHAPMRRELPGAICPHFFWRSGRRGWRCLPAISRRAGNAPSW